MTKSAGPTFPTLGLRAWYAYQCLPRDERGNLPTYRELERGQGLANATLRKLFFDAAQRPSWLRMQHIAAALRVTPEWLAQESGPGPVPRGPVYPRPEIPESLQKRTKSSSALRAVRARR